MSNGWIGVDLDGTLAQYESGDGVWRTLPTVQGDKKVPRIGAPVAPMVRLVKEWLEQGYAVKIMTARVCDLYLCEEQGELVAEALAQQKAIADWTEDHLGKRLEVTAVKDYNMKALYDDRAFHVIPNSGRVW